MSSHGETGGLEEMVSGWFMVRVGLTRRKLVSE